MMLRPAACDSTKCSIFEIVPITVERASEAASNKITIDARPVFLIAP